jgi:hypothetical protein
MRQTERLDHLKTMPDREKYQRAFEMVDLYQRHVLPFVQNRLGYDAMHELRSVWQAAIMPIRQGDGDHDKYERAHSNWLWQARYSHDFLADELSRDEVAEYKRMIMKLYMHQQDEADLLIYRLFGRHISMARRLLYEMQWLTPINITSQSKSQVTCEVTNCKIQQTAGAMRVCLVDCRSAGTAYAQELYKLKRVTVPVDHGCTITLSPLDE